MTKEIPTEKPEVQGVNDDVTVREAVRSRVAAERRIAELDEALKAVSPKIGDTRTSLRRLQLEDARDAAEAQRVAAQRAVESAQQAARARIVAARKPEQLALDRALLAATEQVHALALQRQRYDEETAARLGLAPPPFVAPALLALGDAIAQLRRAIDGPRVKAPAPGPEPGRLRVRLLANFYRDDEAGLIGRGRDDVFDPLESEGRRLIKLGKAVEVEVA